MMLQGKFRVSDVWQGVSKKTQAAIASVTLNDVQDGGQVKVNFPGGNVPAEFGLDQLVSDLRVKPNISSFGLMLNFVSLQKKQ